MLGTGYDLTRAEARVCFWPEGSPDQKFYAQNNPAKLVTGSGFQISTKHPVGWSGPLHQGMHGTEKPIEIELIYSMRTVFSSGPSASFKFPPAENVLMGQSATEFDEAERWFGQFVKPQTYGIGPKGLCVLFPRNISLTTRVQDIVATRERFDRMLNVRYATIALTLLPYRIYFVSASDYLAKGLFEGTGGRRERTFAEQIAEAIKEGESG